MLIGTGMFGTAMYGVHVPATLEEVTDQAPWERDFGTGPTIKVPGVDSSGGPTTIEITLTRSRKIPYRIEIHEAGGALVAPILRWWGGSLKETANEPSVLEFEIEYDAEFLALESIRALIEADVDRVMWLRDAYGMVIGRYQISSLKTSHVMDTKTLRIVAQDSLAQLQGEGVRAYTTVTDPDDKRKTVGTIVRELLDLQVRTEKIGLASIDTRIAAFSRELVVDSGSIMSALRRLQRTLPLDQEGIMWIDSAGKFRWTSRTGFQQGQVIAVGANMQGVEKDEDRTDLVTRVQVFGAGEDTDTQLDLTDAGEANPWKDRNTGTWGIRTGPPLEDRRITDGQTLLAWANRILDEKSSPNYVYRVIVHNLAVADGTRFDDWEDLYVGSQVWARSEDVNIDARVYIKSITRNLDDPLDMSVELDNRGFTMGRLFAGILARQEERLGINDDHVQNPNIARIYDEDEIDELPDGHDFDEGDLRFTPGVPGKLAYRDGSGAWETVLKKGTNIQSVGASNQAGSSTTEASAVDHVHEGTLEEHTHTDPSDFGSPVPLEGTTQDDGVATTHARSDHDHGINTSLSGKADGTFGLTSADEMKAMLNGVQVSLTKIE